MRTYGKKQRYSKEATRTQRATRESTEWDIRVDIDDVCTIDHVTTTIGKNAALMVYCLVSGIEEGEKPPPSERVQLSRSENDHVHIALVVEEPIRRIDALTMVRGNRKLTDEYATPRNKTYTYAGWYIHHTKDQKKTNEPLIHVEFGTLPMDPWDEVTAKKIERIQKRYGTERTRKRFASYLNLIPKEESTATDDFLTKVLALQDVENNVE